MSYLIPIKFFDPPEVINAQVTPIPAASADPMQVIENTGLHNGVGLLYNDTTGRFIGVYVGEEGEEVLCCVIGNGINAQTWAKIPPGSRVSLRSMTNSPIGAGLITACVVTL